MAFLRHAPRHVHHTVANVIEAQMTALNWKDPSATPLGAPVLRFTREAPLAGGRTTGIDKISPGLVTITLGDELPSREEELGGPLSSQEYPIFVDVFMGTDGEATAVASDVRDILLGRFPGTQRSLDVIDQATGTPVDGWRIELDDVERARPNHNYQVHWQVVKVTATTYFNEVSY